MKKQALAGYDLPAGSSRFKWRVGTSFNGEAYAELYDQDAHCDRCAPVGGFTECDGGFYPWHHRRRQETIDGAISVCERYLCRQLKGKAEGLLKEVELMSSNVTGEPSRKKA